MFFSVDGMTIKIVAKDTERPSWKIIEYCVEDLEQSSMLWEDSDTVYDLPPPISLSPRRQSSFTFDHSILLPEKATTSINITTNWVLRHPQCDLISSAPQFLSFFLVVEKRVDSQLQGSSLSAWSIIQFYVSEDDWCPQPAVVLQLDNPVLVPFAYIPMTYVPLMAVDYNAICWVEEIEFTPQLEGSCDGIVKRKELKLSLLPNVACGFRTSATPVRLLDIPAPVLDNARFFNLDSTSGMVFVGTQDDLYRYSYV